MPVTSVQVEYFDWYRQLTEAAADDFIARSLEAQVQTEPEYWRDAAYNSLAQPVVGVSQYEAQAYARWLSAQTGERFVLPSEVEWEAAARGAEGHDYPRGSDFDAARGNTFETHVRGTTPIGIFPAGATASGIHDLSGNVWEWTRSLWGEDLGRPTFGYPYDPEDPRSEDEHAPPRVARVVRGGPGLDDLLNARASYRDRYNPVSRNYGLGFRLVCASPISR